MQLPATIGFTEADRRRPRLWLCGCVVVSILLIAAAIWFSPWFLLGLPVSLLVAVPAWQVLRGLRGELHVSDGALTFALDGQEFRFDLDESHAMAWEHFGARFLLSDDQKSAPLPTNPELIQFLQRRGLFLRDASDLRRRFAEKPAVEFEIEPWRGFFSGVAGILGSVAGGITSSMESIVYPIAAFVVVFAGLFLARRLLPNIRVCLDQDAITYDGLFRHVRIPYEEIRRVQIGRLLGMRRFVVRGEVHKIALPADHPNIPIAQAILKRHRPDISLAGPGTETASPPSALSGAAAVPTDADFPVKVRTSTALAWLLTFLVLLTLPFGIVMPMILLPDGHLTGAALMIALSASALLAQVLYCRYRVRAYIFKATEIIREQGAGNDTYPVAELCGISYVADPNDPKLHLAFTNLTLILHQGHIKIPLLVLCDRLRDLYLGEEAAVQRAFVHFGEMETG